MLLFGGSGLLGSKIRELLATRYTIISPPRERVDLRKKQHIEKILSETNAACIVYAAGETNVDRAEEFREYAKKVNSEAIASIVKQAARDKIPVIYFSTDAVFKGDQSERPYKEDDLVSPLNFYGVTKAKGESHVLSASSANLVVRLITLYSSYFPKKLDFARNTLLKLSENKQCFGITDQHFNPMFSNDAAKGLAAVIEKKVSGIIHFGAKDYMSNYQFARNIAHRFGYDDDLVIPITLSDFLKGKKAKRAKYTWLDTTKAREQLGEELLHTNNQNIDIFYRELLGRK